MGDGIERGFTGTSQKFGGVHLRKRDAIWYPVVLLAVSDIALTAGVYRMKVE
jgi:hypothetical protein